MTEVKTAITKLNQNSQDVVHSKSATFARGGLRVLVITSCTGEKRFKPTNQLTIEDFKDPEKLKARSQVLSEFACPAGQMYTGLQHLRVMEGINILRACLGEKAVDLKILSAGYGLISENEVIVPYSVTFNSMKSDEVSSWGDILEIHENLEQAVIGYDVVFVLLGDKYLRALKLPVETHPNQTFIFLASNKSINYIDSGNAKSYILTLSNPDASRFGCALVGLKGHLLKLIATAISKSPDLLQNFYQKPETFKDFLDISLNREKMGEASKTRLAHELIRGEVSSAGNGTGQASPIFSKRPSPDKQPQQLELALGISFQKENKSKSQNKTPNKNKSKSTESDLRRFLELPPAINKHLEMQYFIPEWDDKVDAGYDFLQDKFSQNRNAYKDDIYSHEIFTQPNYNGILVSKIVVDKRVSKKDDIEKAGGIHEFIRFPGKIMGDCGAFGYIKLEVPPYNTVEILDYYQRLDFDYGVSIDHLIVGPFAQPGVREKRYELTLQNAEEFITKHQAFGYKFTPIGVAQGWNPEKYAEAVKALVEMGYDYIAIGGVARTPTKEILEILQEVYKHLTPTTKIHLFGVGRIDALPYFRHLGVTSFDSASPLRKAWFDAVENYHTLSGKTYAAVRIPFVDKTSVRIKHLLENGYSRETLFSLEQDALNAIREYDKGNLSIDETLDKLLAYDELLELPRDGKVNPTDKARRLRQHTRMYRELLEVKPWQQCECKICKEHGVETIIFRGNDRNRRRGFHNTYVFYKRFQEFLNNEEQADDLNLTKIEE